MHLSPGLRKAHPSQTNVVSWTSLLATSMGMDGFGRRRVRVRASVPGDSDCCLVIQAYAPEDLEPGSRPTVFQRPAAVAQRVVSSEELARGVELLLVESDQPLADDCVIIAWTEASASDVEFDGLRARPTAPSFLGIGIGDNDIELVLESQAA